MDQYNEFIQKKWNEQIKKKIHKRKEKNSIEIIDKPRTKLTKHELKQKKKR